MIFQRPNEFRAFGNGISWISLRNVNALSSSGRSLWPKSIWRDPQRIPSGSTACLMISVYSQVYFSTMCSTFWRWRKFGVFILSFFPRFSHFKASVGPIRPGQHRLYLLTCFCTRYEAPPPSQEANTAGRWAVPSRHRASVIGRIRKCRDWSHVGTKQTGFSHFTAKCDICWSPSASGLNSS